MTIWITIRILNIWAWVFICNCHFYSQLKNKTHCSPEVWLSVADLEIVNRGKWKDRIGVWEGAENLKILCKNNALRTKFSHVLRCIQSTGRGGGRLLFPLGSATVDSDCCLHLSVQSTIVQVKINRFIALLNLTLENDRFFLDTFTVDYYFTNVKL